jgi:hypothetical protein
MRRRFLAGVAGVAMLAAVTGAPVAAASPPQAVHIEVKTSFDPNTDLSGGPFTASGPAVDAGLVCAAGDATDVAPGKVAAWQSPAGRGINIQIVKQFACDGDGPTFLVKLQVRLDFANGTDSFQWVVVGGSGAYANLHGSGSGCGDYAAYPSGVLDVYDGGVN